MPQMIFVNVAVKELDQSKAFFALLRYTFNPQFTDTTVACMVLSEHTYSMLLTHDKFRPFITRDICDATRATEVLICRPCDRRARVDELDREGYSKSVTLRKISERS